MSFEQFKKCPGCGEWFSLDDVYDNSDLLPTGLIVDPKNSNHCTLHFVHLKQDCRTSFVIHSREFATAMGLGLDNGVGFGGPDCSGLCAHIDELQMCQSQCRIRAFRELMISLVNRRTAQVGSDIGSTPEPQIEMQ
jgi:hypothetical protein